MIRVLIADDEAVVRAGLKLIVDLQDDLTVVGEAADGGEAVRLARDLEPDVILMDIRMPGIDGIEATKTLATTGNGSKIIVLTTYGVDDNVHAALAAGAHGFFLKTDEPAQLLHGIRTVAGGGHTVGPTTTARLVHSFIHDRPPSTPAEAPQMGSLTDRERQVLQHIAAGLSNAEIAAELVIGEGTVKTHVARVLMKLGLRDRVQAAVFAHQHGIVRGR